MRSLLGALSALALLFSIGAANAEETTGKLQKVDEEARLLILEDGTVFILAAGVEVEGVKPGAEVIVSFEMNGGDKVANAVLPKQ